MPLTSLEDNLEIEEEASHILHFWSPFNVKTDENYQFVPDSFLFKITSNLLFSFAYFVLVIFNKVVFHFQITGKEKLKQIPGAKITISNHIHPMDCSMIGIANFPNKTYFPTLESNFGIPLVRHLIKLLNAIPIPENISSKAKFIEVMNTLLKQGKTIHFYPEGSLWPYYERIRHFKDGAFKFAFQNNVPIVPMVYHFKENSGIWKYFKKKPAICLTILDPVYPDLTLEKNKAIQDLKQRAYEKMQSI